MKIKNFTLYTVAAVSIALTSCNKLSSPKFDFSTGLLSANLKTVPVDTTQTVEIMNIAYVTDSMDIQKTLDSTIVYADTKGFVVKQSDILNGKINTLEITNGNTNDNRSFYDYYDQFAVSIKSNVADNYLPVGNPIILGPANTNVVSNIVDGNAFKTYLPTEIPAKGTKTPVFIKISSKPKRVIPAGQEFLLKVSVNSTIQVSKK